MFSLLFDNAGNSLLSTSSTVVIILNKLFNLLSDDLAFIFTYNSLIPSSATMFDPFTFLTISYIGILRLNKSKSQNIMSIILGISLYLNTFFFGEFSTVNIEPLYLIL